LVIIEKLRITNVKIKAKENSEESDRMIEFNIHALDVLGQILIYQKGNY